MELFKALRAFRKSIKLVINIFTKKSFNAMKNVCKKLTFEEFFTFFAIVFLIIRFLTYIYINIKEKIEKYNKNKEYYNNNFKSTLKFIGVLSIIGIFNFTFLVIFLGYKMYYK